MALFTVRPQTRWPSDPADPSAKGAALERLNRTVKGVHFPVHGATHNNASGHPFLHRAPRRPVTGVQPVPCAGTSRAALQGLCKRRQDAVCSPICSSVDDGIERNMPAPLSSPEGGHAFFTAQRVNPWPSCRTELMVAAAVLERVNRTVKRVTFPVYGAARNDVSGHPFLHRTPRRPVNGVQPVPGPRALRAATRAMRGSRPGAKHGPTYAAPAASRRRLRHSRLLGSDATGCTNNHAAFHRL